MQNHVSKLMLLVGAGCLLAVVGCSKVNKENYEQVKMGMDYSEVTGILGSPENCEEAMGAKSCVWGDEQKKITVKFVKDTTIYFSSKGLQ